MTKKRNPESYNPYQACHEDETDGQYVYIDVAKAFSAPDARELLGVDDNGVRRWINRPIIHEDETAEFYDRPSYIVSETDREYCDNYISDVVDRDGSTLTEVIGKDGADYFVDEFITMSCLATSETRDEKHEEAAMYMWFDLNSDYAPDTKLAFSTLLVNELQARITALPAGSAMQGAEISERHVEDILQLQSATNIFEAEHSELTTLFNEALLGISWVFDPIHVYSYGKGEAPPLSEDEVKKLHDSLERFHEFSNYLLGINEYDASWLARTIGCDEKTIDILITAYTDPMSLMANPLSYFDGAEVVSHNQFVEAHDCMSALAFVLTQHKHEQRLAQTGNSEKEKIEFIDVISSKLFFVGQGDRTREQKELLLERFTGRYYDLAALQTELIGNRRVSPGILHILK